MEQQETTAYKGDVDNGLSHGIILNAIQSPLDSVEDVRGCGLSIRVQDLNVNEPRPFSNAIRFGANDSSDMRPMPKELHILVFFLRPVSAKGSSFKLWMMNVNARVEDVNIDVLAPGCILKRV